MEMLPRPTHHAALAAALAQAPAVVLTGPRQVGKTTLARLVMEATQGAIYLDLESQTDLRKLDDAEAFLKARIGALTVIDEVHRLPLLFAELRGLIDEARRAGQRAGQFLLLGSASLDLIQQSSESLAGRVRYIELPPLAPDEAAAAGIGPDIVWLRGGFPESLLATSDMASADWRADFIRSYLERDVPMFAPRIPAATVGRLWRMLANGQGTLLNESRLAQGLDIRSPTVSRYVDLLVDLLLVRRLPPWSGNLGKRLVRSPKTYVRDSGLLHALLEIGTLDHLLGHPIVGASWEGFVIETLIAAAGPRAQPMFYRDSNGAEIDLLFEQGGEVRVAVEIKRTSAPVLPKSFHSACDAVGAVMRLVVHGGADSWPTSGGVTAASLSDAVQTVRAATAGPFGPA